MMQTEGIWKPFVCTSTRTLGQWRPFTNMNSPRVSNMQKSKMAVKKNINDKKRKLSPKKTDHTGIPTFLTNFKIPRRKSNIENNNRSLINDQHSATKTSTSQKTSPIPTIINGCAANQLFRKGQTRRSHILPNIGLSLQGKCVDDIFGTGQKGSVEALVPVHVSKKSKPCTSFASIDLRKKKPMYNKIEENTRILLRNIKSSAKQRAHMNNTPSSGVKISEGKRDSINSEVKSPKGKVGAQGKKESIISPKDTFANAIEVNNIETSKKARVSKRNHGITEKINKKDLKNTDTTLSMKKKLNSTSKTNKDHNSKSPPPRISKRFKRVRPLSDSDSDEEASLPEQNTKICVPVINPSVNSISSVEKKNTSVNQENDLSVPEGNLPRIPENISENNAITNTVSSSDHVDQSFCPLSQENSLSSVSCNDSIAGMDYDSETDSSSSLIYPPSELREKEDESPSINPPSEMREEEEELPSVNPSSELRVKEESSLISPSSELRVKEESSLISPSSELTEKEEEEEEVCVIECNQNEQKHASPHEIITLSDSEDDDIIVVETVPSKKKEVVEKLSDDFFNYLQHMSDGNKGKEILNKLREADASLNRFYI